MLLIRKEAFVVFFCAAVSCLVLRKAAWARSFEVAYFFCYIVLVEQLTASM